MKTLLCCVFAPLALILVSVAAIPAVLFACGLSLLGFNREAHRAFDVICEPVTLVSTLRKLTR